MHKFKDKNGHEWPLNLHVNNVRKLWDLLRINLHDAGDLGRVCNQERYLLLPQIFAVVLQTESERVWPETAGFPAKAIEAWDELLLKDDVFDAAHTAFCEELADFCRRRGRATVAKYLDATPRLLAKETAANQAQLPDVAQMEADLDARLKQIPGSSSTSTPANSESAPTP